MHGSDSEESEAWLELCGVCEYVVGWGMLALLCWKGGKGSAFSEVGSWRWSKKRLLIWACVGEMIANCEYTPQGAGWRLARLVLQLSYSGSRLGLTSVEQSREE